MLIAGALLLLAGAIGAFYFWKATERQVSAAGRAPRLVRTRGRVGGELSHVWRATGWKRFLRGL